jgi:hypothetical protein
MKRHRIMRAGWASVLVLAGLALIAAPDAAVAKQPSGNDGTVKIHDTAIDAEPIVRNEPHVSMFHLHFFFADPTQSGSWEIRAWAPGDKGALVLNGTYDTSADGSDREPATGAYALPSGHYKLFWEGRSPQNVKHKTFWVEYVAPAPTGTARPTGTAQPTGSAAPTGAVQPSGSVAPLTGAPTLPPTDATTMGETPSGDDLGSVFLILAAIVALAMLLTPNRSSRRP